jgi:hypothetical protein
VRGREASIVEKYEWPTLIASAVRYFEVILIGEISIDSVDCVRLTKEEYDTKWDLCFLNLGSKRNEAERALVNDFIQLRRAELDGRVKVEVLR